MLIWRLYNHVYVYSLYMVFVCLVKQASWGLESTSQKNSKSSVDKLLLIYIQTCIERLVRKLFSDKKVHQIYTQLCTSLVLETLRLAWK